MPHPEPHARALDTSPRSLLRSYYRIVLGMGAAILVLHAAIGFLGGFDGPFGPFVLVADVLLLLLAFLGAELVGSGELPSRRHPRGWMLASMGLYLVVAAAETGGFASPMLLLVLLTCVFAGLTLSWRGAALVTGLLAAAHVLVTWVRPDVGFLRGGFDGVTTALRGGRAMSLEEITALAMHCTFFVGGAFLAQRLSHGFQKQVTTLSEDATRDPLTSLPNRRGFTDKVRQEIARAERYAWPISILVIDLDHFKPINDEHGHAFGDAVLSQASRLLRDTVGTIDHLARIGGEEFAVAAVAAEPNHGADLAARIVRRFRTHPWEQMKPSLKLTCSVGVAVLDMTRGSVNRTASLSTLLDEADRALYHVKQNGRDDFYVAGSGTSPRHAATATPAR